MKKKDIYFAGSISGGRNYLEIYKKIVIHLKKCSHNVLSEHVVLDNVFEFENEFSDEEIFKRDIDWINRCDLMIAEVSNPSTGVGYEMSYALNRKKSILAIYDKKIFITRMLSGNDSNYLTLKKYEDENEIITILDEYLIKIN